MRVITYLVGGKMNLSKVSVVRFFGPSNAWVGLSSVLCTVQNTLGAFAHPEASNPLRIIHVL